MSDLILTKRRLLGGIALVAAGGVLAACNDKEAADASGGKTGIDGADIDPVQTSATAQELPQPEGDVDMTKLLEPGPLPEEALGKADAPITVVEYMSMTCPHCAHFHNTTFEPIKEKYIDTGKVRFIIREFPFDPRAAAAFMLARCAPEGQYFPMVSMLFKQQQQWATAENGRDALLQMSKLAGFSQQTFEECLTNQKLLDDVNAVMQRGNKDFGVNSTPTFFINGKKYSGDMSVEAMSGIFDALL
ncbi:Protein-disulfide isomerase [Rhizobium sp. RU20A]|uniref:DsbA family protein n=1 Tax=Rhizobium sp. RU20A TaxID=1907412 RepID=UPI0009548B03|nr:DsbA family protein [Rhizobium sp. RU20A]SIR10844.1 Protein-disulfide isomerase [Rhizobium sp. RU20A]